MVNNNRFVSESALQRWRRRKLFYQNKLRGIHQESESVSSVDQGPSLRTPESHNSKVIGGCCARVCLFGFGSVIAVIGILFAILFPLMTDTILRSQLALKRGSEVYNMWIETPIPMYFKVYMFNLTNPTEALSGTEKPSFTQHGPYVFSEHHSKKNITWNDNSTLTYLNEKQYHFVPSMSNGSLTDRITNLNVIAMTVGNLARNLNILEKIGVNELMVLEGEKLVKTDTVQKLLFDGSDDPLLKILSEVRKFIKNLPPMDKFGYFYQRNYTALGDGVFTMGTGTDDVEKMGLITQWNYSNRTKFPGECGRVRGSYGEVFPPSSCNQDKLYIFANDLCSTLPLTRLEKATRLGVPSVIFKGNADIFSNKSTCYCQADGCPPSGARDVSLCQGAPILMSYPHFYQAEDPSYVNNVDGLSPNSADHEFYLELADIVGQPMKVRARIQLNVWMRPIKGMGLFSKLPKVVMPMLWFSQEADMTPALAKSISVVVWVVMYGRWVLLALGLVGFIMIGTGVFMQVRGCFRRPDDRLLE